MSLTRRNDNLPPARRDHGGFTLVEVLVATLVMALGLLGLAGLHVASLKNTMSAGQRTETSYLAYEIADRMRANPRGVIAGNYNNQAGTEDDCTGAVCTAAEVAGYDLAQWTAAVQARLPNGSGVVCIDGTPEDGSAPPGGAGCDNAGTAYAIKIWWNDTRTGDSAQYQRFVTSFVP
jgi:type IV pilus assembly protein PilV